jgi:hypothetical protein
MAAILRVETVDPLRDSRWDTYVCSHPNSLFYHRSGWLAALTAECPTDVHGLVCVDGSGTVQGVLALVETRGLPLGLGGAALGRRLSSLPRTPVAGPLTGSHDCASALVTAAIELASDRRARLQLKMPTRALDGISEGLVGTPWRESHVVPLPATVEELRFGDGRHHATIMRGIRKAQRAGLTVRTARDEPDLRRWYRLYLETCRYRAQPARGYAFFSGLWRAFRESNLVTLLVAERAELGSREMVAGYLLLTSRDRLIYAFAGGTRRALPSRPNELLHWEAMRAAIQAGLALYDMGEVGDDNEGLSRYKAKWGGTTERSYRYHLPAIPDATGNYRIGPRFPRARSVALAAWRQLPLDVTAFIGERVYRRL